MYGLTQNTPVLMPPRIPHVPGMPGSFVPPWVVPELPQEMLYGWRPTTPPFMPIEQMPMDQMAFMPPPGMPVYNRPFIPQPIMMDPNAMYQLPPVATRQWMV